MSKKFEEMKEFLDVYFCMDYDLFGENVDEIVKCYVYDAEENDIFRLSNELHTYLNDNSDDKNDILFNSIFDIHYC
ncbi:contact-dependent growth inhibition system immunity protein, partial [Saccharibacter floricola]